MKTFNDHYKYCRSLYNQQSDKYKSVYDLRVDSTFLDEVITPRYYELIEKIRNAIDFKISNNKIPTKSYHSGTKSTTPVVFKDDTGHAIRINKWDDIHELKELTNLIMPIIERDILGCNGKIEFLHPYRNIPIDQKGNEKSSWTWHYDDCPDEFLKLFIHLNEVTKDSGCLKYIQDCNGNIPVVKTYNKDTTYFSNRQQVFPGSRIPNKVIQDQLNKGGKIIDITGKPGSYAICTPNIYHRASCPEKETQPRDVLFFFIRPSIKKYKNYIEHTNSYFPYKNQKTYNLN